MGATALPPVPAVARIQPVRAVTPAAMWRSARMDSGMHGATWNPWGMSGQSSSSTSTPAAWALCVVQMASSHSISLLLTCSSSGTRPLKSATSGDDLGMGVPMRTTAHGGDAGPAGRQPCRKRPCKATRSRVVSARLRQAGWPFYVPYVCPTVGFMCEHLDSPDQPPCKMKRRPCPPTYHESNDEVKSNMALKRTAQGHGLLLLINGKSSCRVRGYRLSTRNAAALAAPHCAAAQTGSNFSAIAFDQCHKCPRL